MKTPIAITRKEDAAKLATILEIFSQLDDMRWNTRSDNSLINYCCDDLSISNDGRLLTHWLSYISDRLTRFERVWEVGYVISHLVLAFGQKDGRSVRALFNSYCVQPENSDKLWLVCDKTQNGAANARLARYGVKESEKTVKFASRCPADDLVRVFRTLDILAKRHDRSFAHFLAASFHGETDYERAIKRMATALDRLTYPAKRFTHATFKPALEEMEMAACAFTMPKNIKEEMFDRKRLWCCVRDYLKSPEFNPVFVGALKERGVENPERWDKNNPGLKAALDTIELPGDVWNNNAVFRDGLFTPYLSDEAESLKMPQTIRRLYRELKGEKHGFRFYPEQLDVSFDFVQQMCEREMCDVCLFGGGIEKVCHKKSEHLCPVALASCGYRHDCDPEKCLMKENKAKHYCKHYGARERL